ncbi:MAG: hypothetical protein V1891_03185 [bacterium]
MASDNTVKKEEEKEVEEGGEEREREFDEYEEENRLRIEKGEERNKKEEAEDEKVKIPEKIKMEAPGEIVWWILSMELWSLLFAPLFFLLILVEWMALKVAIVFKFPKWKKILTGIMFIVACFEILIFVVLIVMVKEKWAVAVDTAGSIFAAGPYALYKWITSK